MLWFGDYEYVRGRRRSKLQRRCKACTGVVLEPCGYAALRPCEAVTSACSPAQPPVVDDRQRI